MLEFRTEWDITEGFYGHIEGCCGRQGGRGGGVEAGVSGLEVMGREQGRAK